MSRSAVPRLAQSLEDVPAAADRELADLLSRQLRLVSDVIAKQLSVLQRQAQFAAPERPVPEPSATLGGGTVESLTVFEQRPLAELVMQGQLERVHAAAIGYLPDETAEMFGVDRNEIIRTWLSGRPQVGGILDTSFGRLALITAPCFLSDLLADPKRSLHAIVEALQTAGKIGARAVSLMGLLPATTDYGRAALRETQRLEVPDLTTGYPTAVATVTLNLATALARVGRRITQETVGFLGLGSIGSSVLRLMLTAMEHPHEILLCDLPSKAEDLRTLAGVARSLGYRGEITALRSTSHAPPELYRSSLIVGAPSVPDVLDIERLRPGAIVINDSTPQCFRVGAAIQRMRRQADILVTEGDMIRLPNPMKAVAFVPASMPEPLRAAMMNEMLERHPQELAGCSLSALLCALPSGVKPSVGIPSTEDCLQSLRSLETLALRAATPHCRFAGTWRTERISKEIIDRFSARFGGCRSAPSANVSTAGS